MNFVIDKRHLRTKNEFNYFYTENLYESRENETSFTEFSSLISLLKTTSFPGRPRFHCSLIEKENPEKNKGKESPRITK